MSDISKCNGVGNGGVNCPKREKCYRYTAKSDEFWQAWIEAPFSVDMNSEYYADGFFCPLFWGTGAQQIYDQLKDIVNGKEETLKIIKK